ncbi:NUDIX hydrolase-like domain superfamily [Arabidopsis thaliana x Arabidopsis arenosa]|uniref:Nudix hydrolase n=2 Tax=Arabidopsis thaliana x Arabidopsis arenosa TaxID=1240361 RepID=A0A8T2AWY1_9BRAS|nr:NUDIX hydrolase-like domain superfamily [Arabidopsis thaliana x Arabidopsis arenosa]
MGLTKTLLFLVFCCQRYILLLGYCSMDGEGQQISLLDGVEDRFGGIVVNLMEVESMTVEDFDAKLDASLKAWKDQGKKGIWIKLPRELSSLVDTAIKKGFTYHHAENEYVMLTSWLPEPPSTLPCNASHRIGIGAFVLNKNGEMLVVQENSGYFRDKNVWKVPTGTIKEGESIWAGAVREVKEETDIDAEFVEVLAFMESHQAVWQRKTDIFFVCELEASTFEIKKQDSEIYAAKWMPVEEYVNQPFHNKKGNEMFKLIANICLKRSRDKYTGFVLTTDSPKKSLYCSVDHANLLNETADQASTSL